MTTILDDDIFDDTFHSCALHAWLELAAASDGFPDEEATRRRAFCLYEEALAERQGRTVRQSVD